MKHFLSYILTLPFVIFMVFVARASEEGIKTSIASRVHADGYLARTLQERENKRRAGDASETLAFQQQQAQQFDDFAFFMFGDGAGRTGLIDVLIQSLIGPYYSDKGQYVLKRKLKHLLWQGGERVAGLNHDGTRVVSGGMFINLWDVETGKCVKSLAGYKGWVSSVSFSKDDAYILSATTDGAVKLWDADTNKCLFTMEHVKAPIRDFNIKANFNHDTSRIVSVGGAEGYKTIIKIWATKTGSHIRTLIEQHDGPPSRQESVRTVFNNNSSLFAYPSRYTKITLRDAHNGTLVGQVSADAPVMSVAFSPDGLCMVSGSDDGSIIVWDVQTRKRLHSFKISSGTVHSVCFSRDNSLILSAGANDDEDNDNGYVIQVWDAQVRKLLYAFDGLEGGAPVSASFSGDNSCIVAIIDKKTEHQSDVIVWRATSSLLTLVKAACKAHKAGLPEVAVRRVLDVAPPKIDQAIADEQCKQEKEKTSIMAFMKPFAGKVRAALARKSGAILR